MDHNDWPLQALVAGPGGEMESWSDEPVTQEDDDAAIAYFEEQARDVAARSSRVPVDGPTTPHAPAIQLYHSYAVKQVEDPGTVGSAQRLPRTHRRRRRHPPLRRARLSGPVGRRPAARAGIAAADTVHAARELAAEAALRPEWQGARTAVLTGLLRAEFRQHPGLAAILRATGDATLIYDDADSAFWGDNGGNGRNWTGRLLELVRAELHAEQAGIGVPGAHPADRR
ncbi:hypothetical protein GCM10010211_27520 [Streptomyces albospinus]|uniref:Riboflavin biosynthesis intermediates N-glycosidase n=1 Tax=Streptomyces albospinus TaxID=285515 RepID=A0ABQ2UZZ0_9ACTN|nr:NADAR family protein [Streptomyces albospinus]GGU61114.1 hypothetical protein GCM10010211_27520 [Streptomyces albospinus]